MVASGIDYAWSALKSPIVDCGGGIGALEMAILKEEKNLGLEFTIFDISKTVENAKKVRTVLFLPWRCICGSPSSNGWCPVAFTSIIHDMPGLIPD